MMESFGFLAFGFYFFLVFSRMPELIALRFGHSFYQIFISSVLCMVMMVVNGGLSRVIGSKMSILLIVLHVWYVASFPFSYWRTGTLEALSAIMKVLPLAFFAMALVRTEKQLRSTFTIMRAAMLVTLIFTMTAPVSENSDNRLQMDGGRFANSNEIAVYLLLGLPFWLHMATTKRFPMVLRILAGLEIGISIFQCLRTGSRGGLITILLLSVVLLLASSAINRLKVIALGIAVVLIAVPLLPSEVRGRLYSLTGETHDGGAEGSSESRLALLMESVKVAAKHPLFGVGVGVYASAAADISTQAGKKKLWQVSHNAYAQVASEAGLPALFCFLGTLVLAVRSLWRGRSIAKRFKEMEELATMADCILLTAFVYIVNAFFGNIAQELFYYLVCGMAFCCVVALEARYSALERAQTENVRRAAEAASTVAGAMPISSSPMPKPNGPLKPISGNKPQEPVIGRPKPVAPETLYGDVPWARNPNRS